MVKKIDHSLLETNNPAELKEILELYGVAILTDYFDKKYADEIFEIAKQWLIDLDIGLTNDLSSWKNYNMPTGPRYGMYQSIISHCPIFWDLREKMYDLFVILLNDNKLLTSIDGASIYPSNNKPKRVKDWPHIDQTVSSDFMCYQSQFVATDTSASFVATVGSHLKHKKILDLCNSTDNKSNWYKFNEDDIVKLKKLFGDNYQTPIMAKKGSVIFWDSRVIHSAKYQNDDDNNWRCVFYVSMRPKNTFSKRNINTIIKAAKEGRTTNHWGSKIFPLHPRFGNKNEKMTDLLNNTIELSYIDEMSNLLKKMVGLKKY